MQHIVRDRNNMHDKLGDWRVWRPKCTKTFRTFNGVECVNCVHSLSERARFDKVRVDPGLRIFFVHFGWWKESRTQSLAFPTVPEANKLEQRSSNIENLYPSIANLAIIFPNPCL